MTGAGWIYHIRRSYEGRVWVYKDHGGGVAFSLSGVSALTVGGAPYDYGGGMTPGSLALAYDLLADACDNHPDVDWRTVGSFHDTFLCVEWAVEHVIAQAEILSWLKGGE